MPYYPALPIVAYGSFNTSASTSGICVVAHGMNAAPDTAFGFPVEVTTTIGHTRISLKAIDGTNISFLVVSCPVTTCDATTSAITVKFIWMAVRS